VYSLLRSCRCPSAQPPGQFWIYLLMPRDVGGAPARLGSGVGDPELACDVARECSSFRFEGCDIAKATATGSSLDSAPRSPQLFREQHHNSRYFWQEESTSSLFMFLRCHLQTSESSSARAHVKGNQPAPLQSPLSYRL
jgi:hypothetical protein